MAKPLPNWQTHVESLYAFAQIRLIAADLDGTFLPTPTAAMSETLERLRRSLHIHKYDVELTLATGRTLTGVRPILKDLLLSKGIPLILYNGSIVVRNRTEELLLHARIPSKAVKKILHLACRYSLCTYAYFYDNRPNNNAFRMLSDHEYVLGWSRDRRVKYEFNGLAVDWQTEYRLDSGLAPSAILIEATSGGVELVLGLLSEITDITCTHSSSSYIDIRPKGSNKGEGLATAAGALGLPPESVLAIGDNDNDAEMLAWAGIGVAVSEASKIAIANSDFVCKYGAVQGAIEVLRLVKQARRYFYHPMHRLAGGV